MSDHPLTRILERLAEEAISDDFDLRPAIHQYFETSKIHISKGAIPMEKNFARPRRTAAVIVISILLCAALLLATPQGRAWAQNLLRFFSRSEKETFLVPTIPVVLKQAETPAATFPQVEVTHPPMVKLAFEESCGSREFPHCSLVEIQKLVNFPIREVAELPGDWQFSGATGRPDQVWLTYSSAAGQLVLTQGTGDFPDQIDWPVGVDAEVDTVQIGAASGEYVQGAWMDTGKNSGTFIWEAGIPTRTLRWEAEGNRFTLQYRPSKTDQGVRLDRERLVEIAAGLRFTKPPESNSVDSPNIALGELSEKVGFEVREPAWIPERFSLKKTSYSTQFNAACLLYGYPESDMDPSMIVVQSPWGLGVEDIRLEPQYFNNVPIDIPVNITQLKIGGAENNQAVYASNGLTIASLCNIENGIANHALIWTHEWKSFAITGMLDAFDGREFVTKMELQRIAESMTGVSTISGDQLDPGYLHSAQAAEAQAGFEVISPSQLPADTHFAYAIYRDSLSPVYPNSLAQGSPEVILVYFSPGRDELERRYRYLIFENLVPMNTLEKMAMGGGEWVEVNGKPAVFYQVCSDSSGSGQDASCSLSLSWMENGLRIDMEAYLPGLLEKATFIKVAESME